LVGAGWAAVGVVVASDACPDPAGVGWAAAGVCVPLALGVPGAAAEGVPSGAGVPGVWFVAGEEAPFSAGEVPLSCCCSFPPPAAS
jgi:hypothetical protein